MRNQMGNQLSSLGCPCSGCLARVLPPWRLTRYSSDGTCPGRPPRLPDSITELKPLEAWKRTEGPT